MGKKATAGSSAFRPAQSDPNVEEAFRVLEARLSSAEGVNRIGQTEKGYDDTYLKNVIKAIQRELEEHTHRRRNVTAGDSYASDFKASYSGSGNAISISDGYYIFPNSNYIAAADVTIDTSTNGTHYIYLTLSNYSGIWDATYGSGTSISYTLNDVIPYVIAQVDVVDNAIDATTLIQHRFGEIQNPPGSNELRYLADFAVLPTSSALSVQVRQGRIITGTTTTTKTTDTLSIGSTAGTHYVYYEISYSGGIVIALVESTTYPTNTDTYERFVVAEVDVAGSVVTQIRQAWHGPFFSARIYD